MLFKDKRVYMPAETILAFKRAAADYLMKVSNFDQTHQACQAYNDSLRVGKLHSCQH
jgi:hypothetical protein